VQDERPRRVESAFFPHRPSVTFAAHCGLRLPVLRITTLNPGSPALKPRAAVAVLPVQRLGHACRVAPGGSDLWIQSWAGAPGWAADSSAVFVANASNSGWSVLKKALILSAGTESVAGAPMPMTPKGVIQVPQGGLVILSGLSFELGTGAHVFSIPINGPAVVSSSCAPGQITPSSAPAALDQWSAMDQWFGERSSCIGKHAARRGAGESYMRSMMMRETAFYQGASAQFTANGRSKLRAMVRQLPAAAQAIDITVVGVSVSLESPRANLRLARDRAENIVAFLKDSGVWGTVTISLVTTFDLQSFERSKSAPEGAKPMTSAKGKPLTTLSMNFKAPSP